MPVRAGRRSSVRMSGASAGALSATLAVCGVPLSRAFSLAERLTIEAGCLDRPFGLGLLGRFKSIVRQWLDELLPVRESPCPLVLASPTLVMNPLSTP